MLCWIPTMLKSQHQDSGTLFHWAVGLLHLLTFSRTDLRHSFSACDSGIVARTSVLYHVINWLIDWLTEIDRFTYVVQQLGSQQPSTTDCQSTTTKLPQLPLPVIETNSIKVLCGSLPAGPATGISRSLCFLSESQCYSNISFPSVLWHCWLGDRKGIRPVENWVLVCWWWRFDWSLARLIAPIVTTTIIILCFNKHRLTQVHLENGR